MRLILIALLALPVFAADKSDGCGPGWYVTQRTSFSATTTRGTTNSYITPFAMTSGTSHCAKHSIVDNSGSTEFIAFHFDALRHDVVKGGGEHLAALSANLGCRNEEQLGRHLQSHFDELFANRNTEEAIFVSAQQACAL